jgi:hypothetical protein
MFATPDISNLQDATNVNTIFRIGTLNNNLISQGVNPEVYYGILRALVLDYGFSISTAVSILNEIQSKDPAEANAYFRRFIFTTGRKIGYIYNTSLPENDIRRLSFSTKPRAWTGVDLTGVPIRAPDLYIPYGPIRYRLVTPDPLTPEQFVLQNVSNYSNSLDGNILLRDHSMTESFGVLPGGIKMVVSDRVVEEHSPSSYKKIKTNLKSSLDSLFPDVPDTFDGLYNIPEWTSVMLARREKRIKWIIHKKLRNWRVNRISLKRQQLSDAGYIHADLANNLWVLADPMDTSRLANWIRESAISEYDIRVLGPVYQNVLDRLDNVVHTNYPVTIDEVASYLMDAMDMIWTEDVTDQTRTRYFQHIVSLLGRYTVRNAARYLELWLTINGILEAPQNRTANLMDDLEAVATGAGITDPTIHDRLVRIFGLTRQLETSSSNKIEVDITDSVLTESIDDYLNAKAEVQHGFVLEQLEPDQTIPQMLESMLVSMIIQNEADYDVHNDWDLVKGVAPGLYPKNYDTYVQKMLPLDLAFRPLTVDAANAIRTLQKGDFVLQNINLATGRRHTRVDSPLNLDTILSQNGQIAERVGLLRLRAALETSLSPMYFNRIREYGQLRTEIEKLEGKLTSLFSVSQVGDSFNSIYSTEDRDLVDMMIALEGLQVGSNSKNITFKTMSRRERRVTSRDKIGPTVEIKPTVEATIHRTGLYRYTAYFVDHASLMKEDGNRARGTPLKIVTSPSLSETLQVKIPDETSGFLYCLIESLMDSGAVFATGETPFVRVEYQRRCARSNRTFSEFEGSTRPFMNIERNGQKIQAVLHGDPENKPASWNLETGRLLTEVANARLADVVGTFNNLRSILEYCLLMHTKEAFANPNSPWYYRKMWYNANRLDTAGLKKATFISTDPYKTIMIHKQLNTKTEAEIEAKTQKTTLKLYAKLFMLNEYNDYYNGLVADQLKTEVARNFTTVDWRTFIHPAVDGLFVRGNSISDAIDQMMNSVSYLGVLNYCSNLLHLMIQEKREDYSLTMPDEVARSNEFDTAVSFLIECVSELIGRTINVIANLSYEKSEADTDPEKMESMAMPLKKFIAAPWTVLEKSAQDIPKNIPTFETARIILEARADVDADIVFESSIPELKTLFCPFVTRRYFLETYKQRMMHVQIEGGQSLSQTNYIGYNSGDRILPYFYSLTDYAGNDLKRLPDSDAAAYNLARRGAVILRFGDSKFYLSKEDEAVQKKREKDIVKLFEEFASSVDEATATADLYKLHQIVGLCKQYNSILL